MLDRCKTVIVSWSSDMNLGPYAPKSSLRESMSLINIYLAQKNHKNIVLKAGRACSRAEVTSDSNRAILKRSQASGSRPFRTFRAVQQSHVTIDIHQSDCSNDDVLSRLYPYLDMNGKRNDHQEINRVVNIALKASLAYADHPELLAAACGRVSDLQLPEVDKMRSKPSMVVVRTLHAAASCGYLDLIRLLLDRGDISVDIPNESGRTALLLAASYCQQSAVDILLKHGADVNATGSNGESALMWASSCGYLNVMQTLLDGGAKVDMSDNDGFTSLTSAAGGNQVEALVILVKRGAKIDKTNNDGFTALMYASSLGHSKSVSKLLELGADPTACANDGATALIFSAMGGFTETAKFLLDAVEHGGVDSPSSSSNITKTEKKGIDDKDDYYSYLEATTCGDEPISSLSAAAYGGHLKMVKMLLERGASVAYPDDDSKMPLMAAASAGHGEIVRLLLEADPKSIDVTETSGRGGSSALMKAALSGHSEVLKVLLEAGADPFKRDSQNMSPLLAAIRGKHHECVKLLKNAMKKSQRYGNNGGDGGDEDRERASARWAMVGEEDEDIKKSDNNIASVPTLEQRRNHERNSRRAERGLECDVSCNACLVM